jgi:hypothetical protein
MQDKSRIMRLFCVSEKWQTATLSSCLSVCLSLCSRAANAATHESQMVFIRSGVRAAGAGGFSTI